MGLVVLKKNDELDSVDQVTDVTLNGLRAAEGVDFNTYFIALELNDDNNAAITVEIYNGDEVATISCEEACPLSCFSEIAVHFELIKEVVVERGRKNYSDFLLSAIAAHLAKFEFEPYHDSIRVHVTINGFVTVGETPADQLADYLVPQETDE